MAFTSQPGAIQPGGFQPGALEEPFVGDQLLPPSIGVTAALGAPRIVGHLHPPAISAAAALGEPTVAEVGIVVPSISVALEMTQPGVGGELTLNHVSALAVCRLGAPRITSSSILPPSISVGAVLGLPTLVKIEPPSIEVGVALGAPSLTSPILVAMPNVARCELGLPAIIDASRPYSLMISGEDKTDHWQQEDGINIQLAMNGGGSMKFKVVDKTNTYRPNIGGMVDFFIGEDRIFGGVIEDLEEFAPSGANTTIEIAVHCNGYGSILDRRVVFGYWSSFSGNASPGFIADNIRVNFLEADGFHSISTGLQQSPEVDEFFLAPVSATEAYNRIHGMTGIPYYIDPYRTIYWIDPAVGRGAAPVSIVQADNAKRMVANSIRVRSLAGLYRNRTYVNLSRAISPEFTETFRKLIPSPQNVVFYSTFPIVETPTLTVHGVSDSYTLQTVVEGPANLPSEGWEAFWQPGQSYVTLNPLADFWSTTGGLVRLEGTYTIMDGLTGFVYASNETEIETRGNIEGGTGLWEAVENATDVETREQAEALAEALTAQYSDAGIPKEVTFETFVPGWRPGQILTLDLTRPLAQGDFIVTDVTISEHNNSLRADPPFLKYTVKVSNAGLLRRRQQNVQMTRGRSIDGITISLARSAIGATSNTGLETGDNIAGVHEITQGGLFADAHLIFDDPPTGADLILVLQVSQPGDTTWQNLVTLTYSDGRTALLIAPVASRTRYTDLEIDGSDASKVSSAASPFTEEHVGQVLTILSGTGFTKGNYTILSVASEVATLDRTAGTLGSTGGVARYAERKARRGMRVRVNCTQVGSTFAGANGTLRLRVLQ